LLLTNLTQEQNTNQIFHTQPQPNRKYPSNSDDKTAIIEKPKRNRTSASNASGIKHSKMKPFFPEKDYSERYIEIDNHNNITTALASGHSNGDAHEQTALHEKEYNILIGTPRRIAS
jgi:hypothetical protein